MGLGRKKSIHKISKSKIIAIELATKLLVAIQNEDKFSASILLTRIEALGFGVTSDVESKDSPVQNKTELSTEKRQLSPKGKIWRHV